MQQIPISYLALVFIAMVAICAAPLCAQEVDTPRAIDAYIAPYVATNNFSGQLLVTRGQDVVYERQFGAADRGRHSPNTPNTRFHVASISMQLTAAAVMRLVDHRKLRLDTRVNAIVPWVRGGESITIRNLLEQRSGLSDINSRADYANILRRRQTPSSLVSVISRDTLLFPPGSRYAHEEHSAYNLLALIIEKLTGVPFAPAMQRLVFGPAGMTRSAADDDVAHAANLAVGYEPAGVYGLVPTAPIHWSAKTGNGSVYTTARDEGRWVRALFHGTLMTTTSRAVITDSTGPPVGYGWFRRVSKRFGEFAYYMNGRAPGFASFVLYLPHEDVTVVAFSNIYSSATTNVGNDVAAIVLGLPYSPLAFTTPPLPPDSLSLDGARFIFPRDFYQPNATVAFEARRAEMYLRWPSGDMSPLIPLDRNRLIDRTYWEPITIVRDSTGRATFMTYDRFRGPRVSTTPDASSPDCPGRGVVATSTAHGNTGGS